MLRKETLQRDGICCSWHGGPDAGDGEHGSETYEGIGDIRAHKYLCRALRE